MMRVDEVSPGFQTSIVDVLAIDQALDALSSRDTRQCRVVELRFFGGLSVAETADALDISPETVMRDWRFAKVWLLRQISGRD